MTIDRPNRTLSADVDLAVMVAEHIGAHAAAAFLASRGADFGLRTYLPGDGRAGKETGGRESAGAGHTSRTHRF